MATIKEMQDAMNDLINSDGVVTIPGLNFDSVVDNMVNIKYKEQLDNIQNPEDREEAKNNLISYYYGDARSSVEKSISVIKSNYSAVKDGLSTMSVAITATTASNVIPSVITVGTATSTPNPLYFVVENNQKKNTLLSMLKTLSNLMVELISSAIDILFQLPSIVMDLIGVITSTKSLLNAIPV